MARKPRQRLSLSFSHGHRLSKAFVAAGMGEVPSPRDARALIELGLAARAAGLLSVVGEDGLYRLVQPLSAGSSHLPPPTPSTQAGIATATVAADEPQPSAKEAGAVPTVAAGEKRPKVSPPPAANAVGHVVPGGATAANQPLEIHGTGIADGELDGDGEPQIDEATAQLLSAALNF